MLYYGASLFMTENHVPVIWDAWINTIHWQVATIRSFMSSPGNFEINEHTMLNVGWNGTSCS